MPKKPNKSEGGKKGKKKDKGGNEASKAIAPVSKAPVLPPAEVDVAQFEEAYRRQEAALSALAAGQALQPNVDTQVAALVAIGVAKTTQEPKLRARFKRLAASKEYDDAVVDTLAEQAMALWYVRYRSLVDTKGAKEPPKELASSGFQLRSKMLRVLEYNLEENAEVMKSITQIRAGSGYMDLANDLTALAELYRAHARSLAEDKKRYRPEDEGEARRLASALLGYIGATLAAPKAGWMDMQARAWTRMNSTYAEVCRGGIFLVPGEEGARLFPPLVSASRATPSTGGSSSGGPTEPTPSPQGGAEPKPGA